MPALSAAIGALVGLTSLVKGAMDSETAHAQGEEVKQRQIKTQDKLEKDLKNKQQLDDDTATNLQARARQRANASGALGKRATLLTGPLGLTDPAQTANKTLLGM